MSNDDPPVDKSELKDVEKKIVEKEQLVEKYENEEKEVEMNLKRLENLHIKYKSGVIKVWSNYV